MKKSLILCACLLLLSACATRQPILSGQTLASGGERTDEQLAVSFEKADLALRFEPASRTPHVARRAPWDGGFVWSNTADGQPWVASAVQGEGCDLFWPCIDHPMGKAKVVDQHITVPAPLVAAGAGVGMGMDEADGWRTWHWRVKNPSTYGISVNVGPYQLLSEDYPSRYGNTIPLRFWHLPQSDKKAHELMKEFAQILDFFESTIGPYPFGDEKTFFRSVRKMVYGTEQPAPGKLQPRYGTTREFIGFVNEASGRDLNWFFDVYMYQAELPELVATPAGGKLALSWKTQDSKPFPMPVEVRVGGRTETVAMAEGKGEIALPAGATWTLDPHSKLLRRARHIEEFLAYEKARKAKKAG